LKEEHVLDLKTIEEMQQSMLEEHRKDLEALERLKRFLPQSNAAVSKPKGVPEDLGPQADLESLSEDTIIGKVEQVMTSDTARRWTVPLMFAELRRQNFPLAAQKPERTLGLILRKLADRKVIKIVKRGSGRSPNVYKAVVQEQAAVQEGDSEFHLASERATNGSPLPFDSRLPS
jgi:hypothetical protein